jgi:DNA-binding NtrC family response regulator
MPGLILIADDEGAIREALAAVCRGEGHAVLSASTADEALAEVERARPDVLLLDLHMPGRNGLDVLPLAVAGESAPAVVVMTGRADVPTAVLAMRRGAADFLEKPVRREVLVAVLERALRARAVRAERDRLREELAVQRGGPLLAESPVMRRLLDQIARVASTPSTTVLIQGESGAGKELVARAVHERSERRERPFVALNCAALNEPLLEAELCGYEPGAFTGARPKGAEGLLAEAEGGSLLLDEVGELAPALQAKLLRVLQERVYRRVGESADRPCDVRFIASTHRDLGQRVADGLFREDLFYRLNVLSLRVAPLRERREDVLPLATRFLGQLASRLRRELTGFSGAAVELLQAHDWPGNVRELANAVERAALLADGPTIEPAHLGSLAVAAGATRRRSAAPAEPAPVVRAAHSDASDWEAPKDLSLRSWEEALIRRVLRETDGNRSEAARHLGVNRTTLYNKMKRYGIESDR